MYAVRKKNLSQNRAKETKVQDPTEIHGGAGNALTHRASLVIHILHLICLLHWREDVESG